MSPIGTALELQEIIRCNSLSSVFQPILDLRNATLFGYEALTRGPANSIMHSPLNLFETANRHDMMAPLEFACSENSCKRFVQLGAEGKLFLNVSPISLLEKKYQQQMTDWVIRKFGLSSERVVIELSEQYPLDDYVVMRSATAYFREMGFEIAIDDLGAGYAGLRAWSELRPDYVKVDRHFIEQINEDPIKREFLRSILDIAKEMDCKVVAEGIETAAQLSTVQAMGVHYGQGYFLGRPESVPAPAHLLVERITEVSAPLQRPLRRSQTVAEMVVSSPTIEPWTPLDEVIEIFQANRALSCLPVVEEGAPIGLIQRQEMLELYTARYSRELYGRRPARFFVDKNSVIVGDDRSLEEVSRLMTADGDQPLSQDFIIKRGEKFFGVGKTSTLLRRITEQQIRNARYANPLTLLPGNVPIHEMLDELLERGEPFHVAYCDVDYFKPYNDYYGYSKGDEVIVRLANIAQCVVDDDSDFVGHIGGDDFMLIFRSADWQQRAQRMLKLFEQSLADFYCDTSFRQGGIFARSRNGDSRFFPLLTLSIGVVFPDTQHCFSHHDIAALAVDAKHEAKQQAGNSIFISRRRRPQSDASAQQLPALS
ncbi:MAG: domain/GGDEF domain protein [Verrucomicrobiaceae bacterium]|nr:domain/GGDEF domain protein [Verrucomicrobiaceae bacterium]